MASIDLKTASLILDRAFVEAELSSDEIGQKISEILRGTHKTYRYILVTALLAKATNGEVNILSLQKGDGEDGKYDARSLCHKVLVPFETLKLPGCLGSSNEPYLNKPARFVSLSLTNAVRRGRDFQTLSDVIDVLSNISPLKTSIISSGSKPIYFAYFLIYSFNSNTSLNAPILPSSICSSNITGISKSVLTSSKVTPDTSLELLKVSPTSFKVLTPFK